MRGFVIAGTHSGCGKTTVTLGLLSALRKKGLIVQPFKAGPDFIDSGLHRIAAGVTSRNLDLWMCGDAYVRDCFHRYGSEADIAVVEGVMGLYDGALSTASLSHVLGLPVILVVDAYGMAESAGALIKGFRQWGSELHPIEVKGVIFNRVASSRHYERLTHGVEEVTLLGYVPRDMRFEIPHRHLGLMVAEEEPVSPEALDRLTEAVLGMRRYGWPRDPVRFHRPASPLTGRGDARRGATPCAVPGRRCIGQGLLLLLSGQHRPFAGGRGRNTLLQPSRRRQPAYRASTRSISAAGIRSSTRVRFRRTLPW